ncbi:MAG TPA: hypothetical protein VFA10_07735 [Ktedonobacteraceae bacterium]|nr:hypothetical protein [Ktedonobacteraceae bacterium]
MKKYDYHLDVFNEWSPRLAYVLGLALTDGTVHTERLVQQVQAEEGDEA